MNLKTLTDRQKGLLAATTTAATWSLLAIFLKIALQHSDSYTIVWYRMVVAFAALFFWMIFKKQAADLKVFFIRPGALLVASLCLGFNYLGFMQGVHYASPASAQIFIQLGPLLLALAGLFVFKEKLSRPQLYGLLFCLIGFSLFLSDRLDLPDINKTFSLGLSWIVAAAVTWAIFASIQKTLLAFWKSSQINVYVYLVISLLFFPFVNWGNLASLPLSVHLLLIFLGFNTILAYGCFSIALKYLPATQVSPIITMNPLLTLVFITVIDWMQWTFIPADPIGWKGYLGALTAIMGVRKVLSKKASP